jgi:hypothetical protein
MTDPQPPIPPYMKDRPAPFVYFNGVAAHGTIAGAIELELVARVLIPNPDGSVTAEIIPTAHLRCSPAAAISLKESIDKALEMAKQLVEQAGAPPAAAASSRLN